MEEKQLYFYEFVGPKQHVYIFGAGHCGAALSKVLKPLDFHITIIDEREAVINQLDDSPDIKIISGFADYIEKCGLRYNSYVVVCTPAHTNDYHVLNKILEKKIKPADFEMLCSRKKIGEYMEMTYATYGKDIDLTHFYSPIGLNIGGNTAEEIAISISGGVLFVYYSKSGLNSHLREELENRYWEQQDEKESQK